MKVMVDTLTAGFSLRVSVYMTEVFVPDIGSSYHVTAWLH